MDLTRFEQCPAHTYGFYVSNDPEPYKPCCWYRNGVTANSYQEYKDKISKQSIAENCSYCIDMEKNGAAWSPRQTHIETSEGVENLFVVNASLGNLCNLKCVTCSPSNSTQILSELKRFSNSFDSTPFDKINDSVIDKIAFIKDALSSVDVLTLRFEFLGGEPLISPHIIEFIYWLLDQPFASKSYFNITTNSTTFDQKLMDDITSTIAKLTIQLSVDGIDDMFEYLRSNAKMNVLEENAKKYYELSKTRSDKFYLSYNYTLSWMNSVHFADFYNWVQKTTPECRINITFLEGPECYSLSILPENIRKALYEKALVSLPTENSEECQRALDLYKQHMLNNCSQELNTYEFVYGLSTFDNKDKWRKMDHQKAFGDVIDLIKSMSGYENND